ncbi:MAG: rhodanese-like domain-containing protein [Gordonia sp. (in: high G+C Gram-positive bacteria)]
MTASVQFSVSADTYPVQASAPGSPLSVQPGDYRAAVAAGAIPVDIRSHRKRSVDGALFGALAIDPTEVIDLLTPGDVKALRLATTDARWILVSDDGHEAEWFAWHLQARGVIGAVFVVGGFRRLRSAGINGQINRGELEVFSAH